MERRHPRTQKAVSLIVVPAAAVLLAACGSATPSTTPTAAPEATTTTTATSTTATPATSAPTTTSASATSTAATAGAISADDAQAVRDVVSGYWDAYNAYDPDKAVSYLDENYRTTKEELVRGEIARIKAFSVTLGVTEKTPPVLIGNDEAEIHLTMKEPIGTREIVMKFAKRDGAWTIIYSEEAH